jgi:sulfur carrier protein ThiS adenylyltransferase
MSNPGVPQASADSALPEDAGLDEASWRRYGRQIQLPEIGEAGQQRLARSRVLIVGLGGLGSPAALYLAAGGVGQLWLSDDDVVATSNLQRQILYSSADVQQPKRKAAGKRLRQLNPQLHCEPMPALNESNWSSLLKPKGQAVDLVLDCSDNMATRQLLNRACVVSQIPLLSAAASGWQGALLLFDYRHLQPAHGCYHCLYPTDTEPSQNCRTTGILGPVVGLMGTLQALEAMKFILGIPSQALGALQQFEALSGRWRRVSLQADPACPVCQQPASDHHLARHACSPDDSRLQTLKSDIPSVQEIRL